MNKFHSEKAQILGTAVWDMLARNTCCQRFVLHLCVATRVLDVVTFSLVIGRGRNLFLNASQGVCSYPTAWYPDILLLQIYTITLQHLYGFYHSLDGIGWCISTHRHDCNARYLLLLWHSYSVNKRCSESTYLKISGNQFFLSFSWRTTCWESIRKWWPKMREPGHYKTLSSGGLSLANETLVFAKHKLNIWFLI